MRKIIEYWRWRISRVGFMPKFRKDYKEIER